ncbi:hypothetical protein [Paenibacillus donghaensis]|uniref:Uncharacterized protein n=1 Tax=Paenibacillus donghaensis TaxID=414771 RepID=A0A2Z2KLR6_9BACL|nr:hypothetical protein [Paenibacillus donghaensis]ASA22032.1 hypothetical protein B9T62_15370 [Paenibacillus donghaensis]
MPIEIKVLNRRSSGEAPAGNYKARYLNEKGLGIMQASNPCRSAQIIEGVHSGQVVPYDSYVIVGELPPQAEVLRQNTKIIEALAEAGRQIKEHARKIGGLQEENEKLRNPEYAVDYAPLINAYKGRIWQLETEIKSERTGKKVELPREVASALEWLKGAGYSPAGIFVHQQRPEEAEDCHEELRVIKKYVDWVVKDRSHADTLLLSLINGYTVTPEPEKDASSELRSEITGIIKKWMGTSPPSDGKSDSERLTDQIFEHFQQHGDDNLPF